MSKQLIDRKEQARMISDLNGSAKTINEISYTASSQSSSWKLGGYRDIKTLSNSKQERLMKRGLKIHETKIGNITKAFAIGFAKGDLFNV
jgi:hypothetical protein